MTLNWRKARGVSRVGSQGWWPGVPQAVGATLAMRGVQVPLKIWESCGYPTISQCPTWATPRRNVWTSPWGKQSVLKRFVSWTDPELVLETFWSLNWENCALQILCWRWAPADPQGTVVYSTKGWDHGWLNGTEASFFLPFDQNSSGVTSLTSWGDQAFEDTDILPSVDLLQYLQLILTRPRSRPSRSLSQVDHRHCHVGFLCLFLGFEAAL